MITGRLVDNTPYVPIVISWKTQVRRFLAKIDTGFDGDVKINEKEAKKLDIRINHIEKIRVADDRVVKMPSALAFADFKNTLHPVDVLLAEGEPIIGNGFMQRFRVVLKIDYPRNTVELS